jgi:hypothetical protein
MLTDLARRNFDAITDVHHGRLLSRSRPAAQRYEPVLPDATRTFASRSVGTLDVVRRACFDERVERTLTVGEVLGTEQQDITVVGLGGDLDARCPDVRYRRAARQGFMSSPG